MPTIEKWSNSALSLYEMCPAAARMRYLDKIEGTKNEKATRGNEIHKAIELYLRQQTNELPRELAHLETFLADLRDSDCLVEEPWGFDDQWNIADFDCAWTRGLLDAARWISPTHMHGYDWKTGKRYPPKHLQQEQLYCVYAFARFEQLERFDFSFVYVDEKKAPPDCSTLRSYTRLQSEKLRDSFTRRAMRMLTDEILPPKPSIVNCRYCEFRDVCSWVAK